MGIKQVEGESMSIENEEIKMLKARVHNLEQMLSRVLAWAVDGVGDEALYESMLGEFNESSNVKPEELIDIQEGGDNG